METLPALQDQRTLTMETLLSQAIEKGVTVDVIERLLAVTQGLEIKYAKEAFYRDMADFQAECPIINRNKQMWNNSQKGYKYASLESIVAQVKHLIAKYSFSYTILTETKGELVYSTCVVRHGLGHSEASTVPSPLWKKTALMNDAQVMAASFTYAKRYAFCNAFGILTGDEDTDAFAGPTTATPEQLEELYKALEGTKYTLQQVLDKAKVSTAEELTEDYVEKVIRVLSESSTPESTPTQN